MIGVLTFFLNAFVGSYIKKIFNKQLARGGVQPFLTNLLSSTAVGTISMLVLSPFFVAYNQKVNDIKNRFH